MLCYFLLTAACKVKSLSSWGGIYYSIKVLSWGRIWISVSSFLSRTIRETVCVVGFETTVPGLFNNKALMGEKQCLFKDVYISWQPETPLLSCNISFVTQLNRVVVIIYSHTQKYTRIGLYCCAEPWLSVPTHVVIIFRKPTPAQSALL